jgi:hypothetical protein
MRPGMHLQRSLSRRSPFLHFFLHPPLMHLQRLLRRKPFLHFFLHPICEYVNM